MAFGQDFLNAFFGNEYLKDYTHASKTFTTNGYENSPRLKFLFHVYFNLNTVEIPSLRNIFSMGDQSTIGILVKNIELPKYTMEVETLNQYNRKRVIQKKINYQPVRCVFQDDGGDLIRTLWYNYYSYYYKDPNQPYQNLQSTNGTSGADSNRPVGFSYNNRDIYSNNRYVNDWGYVGEAYNDGTNSAGGKPPFFTDISIYGFNQHKFVQYVLINPLISEWNHDTYDYSQDAGTMENSMVINYETVKYYTGGVGGVRPDSNVKGFADPNYYDQLKSPLSRPGGTRSILGQGGLLDTGIGIIEDLNAKNLAGVIGAVQKAGTAYNTFKNQNIKNIANIEAKAAVTSVLTNTLPGAIRNQSIGNGGTVANALRAPLFPTPPKKPATGGTP